MNERERTRRTRTGSLRCSLFFLFTCILSAFISASTSAAQETTATRTEIVSQTILLTDEDRCRALCQISVEDEFDRCISARVHRDIECRQLRRERLEMCIVGATDNPRRRVRTHLTQESCSYVKIHEPAESLPPLPQLFRDHLKSGGRAPEMLVIPQGTFTTTNRQVVTIRAPFAISRYEITFAEWDLCVSRGGCNGYAPHDEGWGARTRRPVINVSWYDALSYVSWLSRETGKNYRLPSETEWEYAGRAGSPAAFSWGTSVGSNNANCDGCGGGWDNSWTAPVGSFAPNRYGLHDIHGNVWEWVEDCWHRQGSASQAPYTQGTCHSRVLRGGSWTDKAELLTFQSRLRYAAVNRSTDAGFRVVSDYDD